MQKELSTKFKKFCKCITKDDRIAVLHHSDTDGFCSALIAIKAVEQLTGKQPALIEHYEYGNEKKCREFIKAVKKKKVNKLIAVDLSLDGDTNCKKLLSIFDSALIIDHHKIYKNLNSKKIVFLKAGWFSKMDSAKYPCSKFCFDLFENVTDISSFDWIACVGILGDMGFESWKSFIQKTLKKRKFGLKHLNEFKEIIAATEVMAEHQMNSLLKEFYNAKNPKKIIKGKFSKYVVAIKKERTKLVAEFINNAEFFPEADMLFYYFKIRKDGMKSYVINNVSQIFPDKTIVIMQDSGKGGLRVSGRRQDYRVKVNNLLEKSVKGIPNSSAGGHIPAAAGRIPKKFKKKFKERLIRNAEKMRKKQA